MRPAYIECSSAGQANLAWQRGHWPAAGDELRLAEQWAADKRNEY